MTAALWALPLLAFLPLGSYDAYSYACQGWQQSAGLDPYAGGVDLLGCPWADAVAPTWRDAPAPYGPLFLVLAGLAAKTGTLTGTLAGLRLIALLGVALIAVSLPVLARRGNVPLGRAVWLTLACPLVPIHLISGAHNDALMVGLLVAGLAAAIARRGWAAGLLLGLAIAVKATAVVVVPFALLLLIKRRPPVTPVDNSTSPPSRQDAPVDKAAPSSASGSSFRRSPGWVGVWVGLRATRRSIAGLGGGVLIALAVCALVSGRGFGWVTALSGSGVSVQWTSPPTAVGITIGLFGPDAVPVTRIVGIVVLAVVLVLLWRRAGRGDSPARDSLAGGGSLARDGGSLTGGGSLARDRGSLAHAHDSGSPARDPLLYAGYALAATVVLAPVFHPWYALWPLAVLAATLHDHLRWLVVPCATASALCLPDGYNLALAVKTQGAVAMTAFIIYLTWKSVHEAKSRTGRGARPDHTPDRLSRRDA